MNETAEPTPDVSDESLLPEAPVSETPDGEGPVLETPTVVVPDRADAPVSEVTERFLRAVIARVPLERIEELHLFAPLRQGGVETGIAVVAARVPLPDPVAEVDAPSDELALEASDASAHASAEGAVDSGASSVDEAVDVHEADTDAADAEVADVDLAAVDLADLERADVERVDLEVVDAEATTQANDATEIVMESAMEVVSAESSAAIDDDSPYRDDVVVVPPDAPDDDEMTAAAMPETPSAPPIVRHTVYTARYRLVLKGPERGRWETDVVDEADAPLITVETVVRGVQRRAGEESETLRYTDRQIARALRLPWPLPGADGATGQGARAEGAPDVGHV